MANSNSWYGDVAAALALMDPSGQGSKAFVQGLQNAQQNQPDSGDGTAPAAKKVRTPADVPQTPFAPLPGMPGASGSSSGAAGAVTQPAPPAAGTAPAGTPAPIKNAGTAPSVAPAVAPVAPAQPQTATSWTMPKPLAALFSSPAVFDGKPLAAPDALNEIAGDEDVWGGGAEPTISALSNSIRANGLNHPATAQALMAAAPKLRQYAASTEGSPEGIQYARSLLHAYSMSLQNPLGVP